MESLSAIWYFLFSSLHVWGAFDPFSCQVSFPAHLDVQSRPVKLRRLLARKIGNDKRLSLR
jgi:hypothetical protein